MTATMPSTMTVIEIETPGGPEVLKPVARAVPTPGPGDVLIHVAAAGVNRPDLMQRQGKYPPPPGAPDIPGLEVAGTIAVVGPENDRWRVGDRVMALVAGGGYAEYCVAPGPQCLPVPAALTMEEAGALPETLFTVWTNVFERGHLEAGESLLVHGGASGIGTIAVQLAKARGARVFATAGGASKCAAVTALGAERTIDYRTEDFVEIVRQVTDGRGVDVILDMVGGDYVARNLDALAMDGRLVQIAFLHGPRAEINLNPLMRKRITFTGSTLRPRTVAQKGAIARAIEREVWPIVERGELKPVIHARVPLREAAHAHALLETGEHVGKVVLVVPLDE